MDGRGMVALMETRLGLFGLLDFRASDTYGSYCLMLISVSF